MSKIEEGDLVGLAISDRFVTFVSTFKIGLAIEVNIRQTDGFFWDSEEVVTVLWSSGKCTTELRNRLRRL